MRKRGVVEKYGTNDSNDNTQLFKTVNGKSVLVWRCPFYAKWKHMLKRCYGEEYQHLHKTYIGCSVCDEWLTFSNFKRWMETQDWEGKDLDKDLLVYQNKIYSPETCCFLPQNINKFLTKTDKNRGTYPLGVWKRKKGKTMIKDYLNSFVAGCGLGKGQVYIGVFNSPMLAHKAWQKAKAALAFDLALNQTDERIKQGLMRVYEKILTDYEQGLETIDF